ncbi:restriction endonuclease subunit S [bacterium]|nr:restriction endonuclease subunit S [bacterium]
MFLSHLAFSVISKNPIYITNKFIYYFLKSKQEEILKKQKGGAIPSVYASDIGNMLIPLPPIQIQNEIVNILDQFNDLTNSISLGLPKEIELRKEQYDYYRNKLLTFKQLEK